MANPIKYNNGTPENEALNSGNFSIGTNDVGKGPSISTQFFNGVTPPDGGYAIYEYDNDGAFFGPIIADNDSELITITNRHFGQSFTTLTQCFDYYQGQDDKMMVNRDFDPIITDELVCYLDVAYSPAFYSGSSNWYDLVNTDYSASLIGDMTYASTYGGVLSAEGSQTSNYIILPPQVFANEISSNNAWSLNCWVRLDSTSGTTYIFSTATTASSNGWIMQVAGGRVFPWNETVQDGVGVPYTAGETFYLSLVISGSSIYLYKNGSYKGRYSYQKSISNTVGWVLNQEQDGTLSGFDASQATDMGIYSIKVYNKTLSAEEVLQNYNAQKSRFGL